MNRNAQKTEFGKNLGTPLLQATQMDITAVSTAKWA